MAITDQIRGLIGEDLATMRGRPFQVARVSDNTVIYRVGGRDRPGQMKNYEAVLDYLGSGNQVNGPGDIQKVCPTDQNTAYEWAVLKRLRVLR